MTRLLLIASLTACAAERSPLAERLADGGPKVIAHRGGDDLAPEATLLAFQRAWEAGAHVLEVDVRRSSDGVLYMFHDDTLDRTTDGTGPVEDLSWEELRALDAAYDWSRDGGETYPLRGTGIRIPSIPELFEGVPGAVWNLDIKSRVPDAVPELAQLIRDHDLEDAVCIGSFDDGVGEAFRAELPEACTYYSEGRARWSILGDLLPLDSSPGPRFEVLSVPTESSGIPITTEAFVRRAHRRDQLVWVWTVNDRDEMEELIELGVDGLITDEVERALDVTSAF